ncbi:MAG: isoamylase early set domain-containing protein [Sedimentisphaerales bacterium]|nr:isoamylase early set domain-containing protein [Sedimentisphaerales bacterium]
MAVIKSKKGEITFIFDAKPEARQVYVAGDFNQWNPADKKMIKAKDGSFRAKLTLSPGPHQYKFVADGTWVEDSSSKQKVHNSFGGVNSVVEV